MARDKGKDAKEWPVAPADEVRDVRYGDAVAEIEQLLASIDRDEVDIDELSVKVERAVALLKVCREKLKATELRVTQVLEDLAAEEEPQDGKEEGADDDALGSEDDADADPPSGEEPDRGESERPTSRRRPKKDAPKPDLPKPPDDPDELEELPF